MPTVKAVTDAKWYSCHKVTWSPTDNYLQFFDIPLSLIFQFTFSHYRNPLITPEAWNHWRCLSPNAIWFSFLCQRFQRSQEVVSLLHMESSTATASAIALHNFVPIWPREISSHHNRAWETMGYSFTRDWVLQDRTAICLKLNSYILGLTSVQWLITVHSSAFVQLLFSLQPFQSPVSPLHKLRSSLLRHFIIILKSNLAFLFYELFQSHWPVKVCL